MLDPKRLHVFNFFDLLSNWRCKIKWFNDGLIYDRDLIGNCETLMNDQRRLIVRYSYVRAATEVCTCICTCTWRPSWQKPEFIEAKPSLPKNVISSFFFSRFPLPKIRENLFTTFWVMLTEKQTNQQINRGKNNLLGRCNKCIGLYTVSPRSPPGATT